MSYITHPVHQSIIIGPIQSQVFLEPFELCSPAHAHYQQVYPSGDLLQQFKLYGHQIDLSDVSVIKGYIKSDH